MLGGPRDGEVVRVDDVAAGIIWYPPEPDANFTAVFGQDDDLEVLPPVEGIRLPIVSFITREAEHKLVAAWPFYNWPTRS